MRPDDLYSAICREALESRQRDVMSFVDNGMTGMSTRLEKTLFRLPDGHYLLGLGPYNAGLVRLDFEELLIGREVPEFIGVGMPVQPPIVRDLDPAEDEAASRRKVMSVVADADPREDRGALD